MADIDENLLRKIVKEVLNETNQIDTKINFDKENNSTATATEEVHPLSTLVLLRQLVGTNQVSFQELPCCLVVELLQ